MDIKVVFEKEFGRTISSSEYGIINSWLEKGFKEDLIIGALKEAKNNGVKNVHYIAKILDVWDKKGFKVIDDIKNYYKEKVMRKDFSELEDKNNIIITDEFIMLIENKSPYEVLKFICKIQKLSSIEKDLLSFLLIDMELQPSMVNALIYVMVEKNKNKLDIEYIKEFVKNNLDILEQARSGREVVQIINKLNFMSINEK